MSYVDFISDNALAQVYSTHTLREGKNKNVLVRKYLNIKRTIAEQHNNNFIFKQKKQLLN
jgi:hypothetical protein